MIKPQEYYASLKEIYSEKGDPIRAEQQMRYTRNQFAYYGLRSPEWVGILKEQFKRHGKYAGSELKEFALLCYEDEYREMNYSAIQMIQKVQKKEEEDFIDLLEHLIIHKSWWDTVDWIAKLVGIHFKIYPHLIDPYTERWIVSENMWLNRVAIIFQLFYKEQTDQDRLFRFILICKEDKDFFIRKAMGWALRQYSKTNPEAVIDFVRSNPDLPNLTKKEALRLLK